MPVTAARPPGRDRHSLTSQQARVWASGALNGGPTQHRYACGLPPQVRFATLADAVRTLVDRHTALRTRIGREDGCLYQCADGPRPTLESRDAEDMPEAAPLVDVTDGPAARFLVVHQADGTRRLVVALHGSVADGWSRMIVLTELDKLVTSGPGAGPALRPVRSLGDVGDQERRWRSSADYARRLGFWENLLRTDKPDPVGRPERPGRRTGVRNTRVIGSAMAAALRDRGRDAKVGPAALYLCALAAAAAGLTGAAVVPLCLLTSGRNAEIGTSVGVFANHVPTPIPAAVAVRLQPAESWEVITRALRHEVPLAGLVEASRPLRAAIADLTSAGIGFQVAPAWPAFGSLSFRPVLRPGRAAVPFSAVEMSVRTEPDSVRLDALHDPSRCPDDLARGLLDGMAAGLAELSGSPAAVTRRSSAIRPPARSTAGSGKGPRLACP